jgi:hypothetical protein
MTMYCVTTNNNTQINKGAMVLVDLHLPDQFVPIAIKVMNSFTPLVMYT